MTAGMAVHSELIIGQQADCQRRDFCVDCWALEQRERDVSGVTHWRSQVPQTVTERDVRTEERAEQVLTWLRGGERWLLKSPQHCEQIQPLLNVFPDATFVKVMTPSGKVGYVPIDSVLPLVGEQVARTWSSFANDTTRLFEEARRYIEPIRKIAVASGATLLGGILQLTLSIFIAFFFLRDGDAIVLRLHAAIPGKL